MLQKVDFLLLTALLLLLLFLRHTIIHAVCPCYDKQEYGLLTLMIGSSPHADTADHHSC